MQMPDEVPSARMRGMKIYCFIILLLLSFATHSEDANSTPEVNGFPGIKEFIDEMVVKHNFKRAELDNMFDHVEFQPRVIEAITRPATLKPWLEYRAAFVNPERISKGLKFWKKYRKAFRNAEREYGVPQEIILAVIGVETVYGQDTGSFRTLDALTTLAFNYPRRADFFRKELENYLLLARDQQFNLLEIRGSYAGALGIPQFMPSSYRTYAVDFNGNHKIDLLHEDEDAIGSVASYLKQSGWRAGATRENLIKTGLFKKSLPVAMRVELKENLQQADYVIPRTIEAWAASGVVAEGNMSDLNTETARLVDFTVAEGKEYWLAFNNFDVITRYNNSDFYAMSVFQLAQALRSAYEGKTTN